MKLLLAVSLALISSSAASTAFPARSSHFTRISRRAAAGPAEPQSKCDISHALLEIPGEGDVDPIAGQVLEWIALGTGEVQYRCQDDSTWQAIGSRGNLYDASCTYAATSPEFLSLTTDALKLLPGKTQSIIGSALSKLTSKAMPSLGSFYLHEKSQKFDMRKRRGGPLSNSGEEGWVVTKLAAEQKAPVSSYDVPWEKMVGTSGSLAENVFRVSTAGGMPNSPECRPGSYSSVPFSAQFWFYKTSTEKGVEKGEVVDGKAPEHCEVEEPRKETERELAVMINSVIYGDSMEDCTSTDDCSAKCLADEKCEGFILSTEDSQGHTKYGVRSNEMIYSPVFISGVVRAITGTQYIDRFGFVQSCPEGQVSAPSGTACVVQVCK